jgi:hypothetical protein
MYLSDSEVDAQAAADQAETDLSTIQRWCRLIPGLGRRYRPPHGRGRPHWAINRDLLLTLTEQRAWTEALSPVHLRALPKGALQTLKTTAANWRAQEETPSRREDVSNRRHTPSAKKQEPRPAPAGISYQEASRSLGLSEEMICRWAAALPVRVATPDSRRPLLDPVVLAAVDAYRADAGGKLPHGALRPGSRQHEALLAYLRPRLDGTVPLDQVIRPSGVASAGAVGAPTTIRSLAEAWREQLREERRQHTPPDRATRRSAREVRHDAS